MDEKKKLICEIASRVAGPLLVNAAGDTHFVHTSQARELVDLSVFMACEIVNKVLLATIDD